MKNTILNLVRYAIVAALYVALTPLTNYLSIGFFQVRIAEVLVLLCFFNKKYIIPLTLGCLIANLIFYTNSLDLLFGTLGTLTGSLLMFVTKDLFVASIFPSITNGIFVSLEFMIINNVYKADTFIFYFITTSLVEFVTVSIIGVILMKVVLKNQKLTEMLDLKIE